MVSSQTRPTAQVANPFSHCSPASKSNSPSPHLFTIPSEERLNVEEAREKLLLEPLSGIHVHV